ncbi:23615_t:CDS:2 [Gigaspora margarita]|uniref:23615_t:CDS:1 n=1 Tax=Gigaspora margarita TaxID=4874 RepID=A0ABM8VW14_GIGMA|nr:23615_t:CDS:2 [Gigaspora margarita]
MSSSETMPSEEFTSSKGDAPNSVTENDVTGTTGIKRVALLHKENEYLMKKITEELTTWSNNNTNSAKYTVISIVISTIALLFGVILFIFEKSNYKQEIKNIISTSIIGTGGSVTLLGSLVSLKELFKRASEGAKDFENTLKSFKALFQDDKKMLDPNYLESFEKYCSTKDISEEEKFKRYNSTISLKDLLGFLSYRIYKESWLIGIIDKLNKELGTNIQKELKLKLEQSILGIKLLQRKRKKESDLNKKKDLDLELKQKKLDRDKYRINLSHEKKVALNIFNQKELKIELDRININLIQENQKTNPNEEDKEELELVKEHKEHKELELKLLKKHLELEKEKQKIDSHEKIQKLKSYLNQITLDLVKKELELNQKRLKKVQKKLKKLELEKVQRKLKELEKELDLTKQKDAIEKLESEISKKIEVILKEIEVISKEIKEKKEIKEIKEIKEKKEIKEIDLKNLKEIDKLNSEKLKKLMLKLKEKKLELSDSENHKLKLEQKQKLKLDLKQKALELVRLEIKFVQDKLDSEEYKDEVEPKLINIKQSELYLELRQKKIKQELVEIKLELDQKKNSDSKEIDELKSESRLKKIELVKKEIEWTQTKLELKKKEIELKLKSQLKIWYIRINYFLKLDPKYEDKELTKKEKFQDNGAKNTFFETTNDLEPILFLFVRAHEILQ